MSAEPLGRFTAAGRMTLPTEAETRWEGSHQWARNRPAPDGRGFGVATDVRGNLMLITRPPQKEAWPQWLWECLRLIIGLNLHGLEHRCSGPDAREW